MMNKLRVFLFVSMLLLGATANAAGWKFGVGATYAGGINDVVDLYEDNYEAENPFTDVESFAIPIGAGFIGRYETDSGLIFNLGVGPAFIISGDISHTEVPLSATIGYAFARNGDASPYIRAGVVSHYVSGDYVEDSDPGALTAIGVEFGRNGGLNWGLEISVDDSTVEFEDFSKAGNTELNSYDRQLTLFFLF
ncbi:MAG: porin family protein [Gammaproteobacteria bacterium]|nr:porin family protein [Gammaproteobacteria bacterium]